MEFWKERSKTSKEMKRHSKAFSWKGIDKFTAMQGHGSCDKGRQEVNKALQRQRNYKENLSKGVYDVNNSRVYTVGIQ